MPGPQVKFSLAPLAKHGKATSVLTHTGWNVRPPRGPPSPPAPNLSITPLCHTGLWERVKCRPASLGLWDLLRAGFPSQSGLCPHHFLREAFADASI